MRDGPDANSGQEIWKFTAGGYIDSPPTAYKDLILFGCSDGWVYCLCSADGSLAWRFRAAPENRLIVDRNRLESAWRVHGSVIIVKDIMYCTAGRSSFLDGGIFLYGINPRTGKVIHTGRLDTRMTTREDSVGKPFVQAFHIEGARSDILVSEGGFIFLNQFKFTLDLKEIDSPYVAHSDDDRTEGMDLSDADYIEKSPYFGSSFAEAASYGKSRGHLGDREVGLHMFSTGGFLDDSWFNRTFWMYAKTWPGFQIANKAPKSGQLLVVGDTMTYAVQAYPTRNNHSPMFNPRKKGYLLIADSNSNEPMLDYRAWRRDKGIGFTRSAPPAWHQWVPIRMRSMVLAGDHLFVAGPPDVVDESDLMAPYEGRKGAILRAVSPKDGTMRSGNTLDHEPVFDGMIAAHDRLFISMRDGVVCCYGGKETLSSAHPSGQTTHE